MKLLFLSVLACSLISAANVTCDPTQAITAPWISASSSGPGTWSGAQNCTARGGDTVTVYLPAGATSVSLYGHSVGSLALSSGTTYTYTPPAHIRATHTVNGVQMGPSDWTFYERIDALPVSSHNAAWHNMSATSGQVISQAYFNSGAVGFYSPLDGTEPHTLRMKSYYQDPPVNSFFPQPLGTHKLKMENGNYTVASFNAGTSIDRHVGMIRSADDTYWGTYGDLTTFNWLSNCQNNNTDCTAGSFRLLHWWDYPTGGGETAASTPEMPLFLDLEEMRAATDAENPQPIHHAIPFTSGCFGGGGQVFPAIAHTCNGNFSTPMGTRWRLKADFNTTGIASVNISNGGSGYTPNSSIVGTVSGCSGTPSVIAYIDSTGAIKNNSGYYAWVSDTGSACSAPTVTFPAPASGTQAKGTVGLFGTISAGVLPYFNAMVTQAQQYGYYFDDIGSGNQLKTNANVFYDGSTGAAVSVLGRYFNPFLFEIVDDTGEDSGGLGTADDLRPKWATNGGVGLNSTSNSWQSDSGNSLEGASVTNQAVIQYTVSGVVKYATISLQGVGIGVPDTSVQQRVIASNVPSYTLPCFVTGLASAAVACSSSNVTWTMTCGKCVDPAPGVDALSTSGVFTITQPFSPANVQAGLVKVYLTADPTVFTYMLIRIVPVSADGAIRIKMNAGNTSDGTYTWWSAPNFGLAETVAFSAGSDGSWPYAIWGWPNAPDSKQAESPIYRSMTYSYFDIMFNLVIQNGNYLIRFLSGQPYNGSSFSSNFIGNHSYNLVETQDNMREVACLDSCLTGGQSGIPLDLKDWATVTNGNLYAAIRDYFPARYGSAVAPEGVSNNGDNPAIGGVEIIPDPDNSVYWKIGSYVPQQFKPGNRFEVAPYAAGNPQVSSMGQYGLLQLFVNPHGTNLNDPIWSLVSGPGSLSTTGLYTAPTTQPSGNTCAVVQAQSASNATLLAKQRVCITGHLYSL